MEISIAPSAILSGAAIVISIITVYYNHRPATMGVSIQFIGLPESYLSKSNTRGEKYRTIFLTGYVFNTSHKPLLVKMMRLNVKYGYRMLPCFPIDVEEQKKKVKFPLDPNEMQLHNLNGPILEENPKKFTAMYLIPEKVFNSLINKEQQQFQFVCTDLNGKKYTCPFNGQVPDGFIPFPPVPPIINNSPKFNFVSTLWGK